MIDTKQNIEGTSVSPIVTGHLPLRLWRRLMNSSLFRHNVLLFAGNMSASIFTFLFHPIVGHILGSEKYGTIVSFGAFALVLSLPTAVIPSLYNKFSADLVAHSRIAQLHYVLRRSTLYAIPLGVLCAAAFAAASPILTQVFKVPLAYALLTGLSFVFIFAAPINWGAIQGRQQFSWFAALNFLTAFLRVALIVVVLLLGWGLNGIVVAGLAGGLIVYAISFLPLRDVFRTVPARLPSFKPLFNYSLGATLALSAGLLLTNVDTALAAPFLSKQDAGYYDALATMGRIVLFAGGSFVWAMFPKVAALQQQGKSSLGLLGWTIAGVGAISAAVVVVFALFPSQVVTIIFHEPAAIARQLVGYGVAMLFLACANVFTNYFLARGSMAFVPLQLACCALQLVLLFRWHGSVAQMVMDMVVVMAVQLFGLITIFIIKEVRAHKGVDILGVMA